METKKEEVKTSMENKTEKEIEQSKKDKKSATTTEKGKDYSYNKPKSGEQHPYGNRGEW